MLKGKKKLSESNKGLKKSDETNKNNIMEPWVNKRYYFTIGYG